MEYMTLKEASNIWGISPSNDKLLLFCGAYSRRRKNGNHLADSQKCEKAIRWKEKICSSEGRKTL